MIVATIHPHFAHAGFRIKVALAVHDGQIRDFARLNRAELFLHAAELGGNRRQCRQRVFLGQATLHCRLHVLAKQLFVLERVGCQRDVEFLLTQQGRILCRPIPRTQIVQRHLLPILFTRQLGQVREIHRHDEHRARFLGEIGPPPFLSAGNNSEI